MLNGYKKGRNLSGEKKKSSFLKIKKKKINKNKKYTQSLKKV